MASGRADLGWRVALAVSVAVQFVILYAPRAGGPGSSVPGMDKVVHLLVFAVVAALAVRAGAPAVWIVGLLAAQALASEAVQALWLPQRGGEVGDLIADAAGIWLGVLAGKWWLARARRPQD